MQYQFDIVWLIAGIVIVGVGAVMLRFYRQIADNFFIPYGKMKIAAIIVCVVGILSMLNLPSFILMSLISAIYSN